MKKFFELGNRYAKESNWTDFALVKFCLFSMGLFVGMTVPEKHKKIVVSGAICIFLLTYIPLMVKVLSIGVETINENCRD